MMNERIQELQAEQEQFDMEDHPPHRLCECRKCMEYFTPLPDCDAFAASGKPIAEQTNTQFMEGYRIGLAEMREKCAKVCDDLSNPFGNASLMAEQCAAAIRAINFEGDTGFRPVSEMIAEHKQDPKKAAAIEKAKMRKAEQEPVAWRVRGYNQFKTGNPAPWRYVDGADKPTVNKPDCCDFEPLYAAPVRTKDLTDDEIFEILELQNCPKSELKYWFHDARAVIAADREKNK